LLRHTLILGLLSLAHLANFEALATSPKRLLRVLLIVLILIDKSWLVDQRHTELLRLPYQIGLTLVNGFLLASEICLIKLVIVI
jgi:hypothetical protein